MQAEDQNRLIFRVDDPVFCHSVFSVDATFGRKVALTILSSRRKYLNNDIKGAGKLFASHYVVPTFMANERVMSEDAVAGDIIGIHNHGQLQIGDTLTEGEDITFVGVPSFAPEILRRVALKDPTKTKQLRKALDDRVGLAFGTDPEPVAEVVDVALQDLGEGAPLGRTQGEEGLAQLEHRDARDHAVDQLGGEPGGCGGCCT